MNLSEGAVAYGILHFLLTLKVGARWPLAVPAGQLRNTSTDRAVETQQLGHLSGNPGISAL